MCLRRAARRHEDCRCGQGNKLQCPYCETPKTVLQGDRADRWSSSQWQTTCNNTCTGSVHLNITDAGWQQQLPEFHQEHTIPPSVLRLSAIGWESLDWGLVGLQKLRLPSPAVIQSSAKSFARRFLQKYYLKIWWWYMMKKYIYSTSQKFRHHYSFQSFSLFLLFSTL